MSQFCNFLVGKEKYFSERLEGLYRWFDHPPRCKAICMWGEKQTKSIDRFITERTVLRYIVNNTLKWSLYHVHVTYYEQGIYILHTFYSQSGHYCFLIANIHEGKWHQERSKLTSGMKKRWVKSLLAPLRPRSHVNMCQS